MSRFYFALALLLALFSSSAAETIVLDSTGNGVLLPTTGGDATNYITVLNSEAATSPYYLYVSINDGKGPNLPFSTSEVESFYFNIAGAGVVNSSTLVFGNATLVNQWYSPDFAQGTGEPGNYLVNKANSNTKAGTYTFEFNIPVLSTLMVNLTYVQSGSNPRPITELITITIFNPDFDTGVVGDPQFVGLRGQSYQVHGIDGAVYNIISDDNLQVNSRFVFLTEGQCPMINGKLDTNCWSHPGSYLGEMSFQVIVDGKLHAALIQSGSATSGFAGIQLDGKPLRVGDKKSYGDFSIEVQDAYNVRINTESFEFSLHNSDLFINQAIRSKAPLAELTAHGLLGQTHSTKTYANSLKFVQGKVDDYVIESDDIFGTDFMYNRFNL